MTPKLILQLCAAAGIALAGLVVARGHAVILTQQGLGLLMVLGAVGLMFRAIDRHFDQRG